MRRYACSLLAMGILWTFPSPARSIEIEPIFWPEFVFVDTAADTNPNSIALFQLTGLASGKPVKVTMHLDDLAEVLPDGDTLATETASMTFFPNAPEGVVRVVKRLPAGAQPGKHTEKVTVAQEGTMDSSLREITVKSVYDKDVARVEIDGVGAGKVPAQKPLAYGRTGALAEGSEISSSVSEPGSSELVLYTIADSIKSLKIRLSSFSSDSLLYEFTEFRASAPGEGGFLDQYVKNVVFAGTLLPGTTAISVSLRTTAVLEEHTASLPQSFALAPNYPNPFNSSTVIQIALPTASQVDLSIYDLMGQRVVTLVEGRREAGTYTLRWDGRDAENTPLASGVYLYRLRAGGQTATRKLMLLR